MTASQPKPQPQSASTLPPKLPKSLLVLTEELRLALEQIESDKVSIEARKTELRNLEEKVLVKQKQLDAMGQDQAKALAERDVDLNNIAVEILHEQDKQIALISKTRALEIRLAELRHQPGIIREELDELNTQVKERKQYSDDQEAVIESLAAEGGSKLWDLNKEIDDLNLQKEEVLKETIILKRQRTAMGDEVTAIVERTTKLQTKYNELATNLKESLEAIQADIAAAKVQHEQITTDSERRLREADIRDKETILQRRGLEKDKKDLNDQQRRFNSQQSIYGSS